MADPIPTDVATAEATLAELAAKHSDAIARRGEIGSQRTAIAFAAHTGDAAAKRQLDQLNAAGGKIEQEILGLAAAVAEAQRRLEDARRLAALAEESAALALLPPVTARIRERAARLDALAQEMVAQAAGVRADMEELNRAGFQRSIQLVITGCRRAAQAAFLQSILENERIPPDQRHTFTYLAEGWTWSVDREIAGRLGITAEAA